MGSVTNEDVMTHSLLTIQVRYDSPDDVSCLVGKFNVVAASRRRHGQQQSVTTRIVRFVLERFPQILTAPNTIGLR